MEYWERPMYLVTTRARIYSIEFYSVRARRQWGRSEANAVQSRKQKLGKRMFRLPQLLYNIFGSYKEKGSLTQKNEEPSKSLNNINNIIYSIRVDENREQMK